MFKTAEISERVLGGIMLNTVKVAASVIILLFLTGCDSPSLTPLNSGDVIVAFGDSLTQGVGVDKQSSYPSILSNLTGLPVINAGISGETTDEGLKRFQSVLDKYKPALVVLLEGGNDILRNREYSTIKSNLENMITTAKGHGIQVVLIGVPEKKLFSSSAPLYHDLAEKHNLVFDPDTVGSLMRSPGKKSDSIHFNERGYAALAEAIYQILLKNGAIE